MAIQIRKDLFNVETGIDSTQLLLTSRMVSRLTGMVVQRNKAVVGANAYAHSSGIHQDGVLKERSTYEIIDPLLVGAEKSEIILTARSGRHGLKHRLAELGFNFTDERFETIYNDFLKVRGTPRKRSGKPTCASSWLTPTRSGRACPADPTVSFN